MSKERTEVRLSYARLMFESIAETAVQSHEREPIAIGGTDADFIKMAFRNAKTIRNVGLGHVERLYGVLKRRSRQRIAPWAIAAAV